jgi:hypothetical protein
VKKFTEEENYAIQTACESLRASTVVRAIAHGKFSSTASEIVTATKMGSKIDTLIKQRRWDDLLQDETFLEVVLFVLLMP